MFDWIADGFNKILAKIDAFIQWWVDLVPAAFTALWQWIGDGFSWAFEQLLTVIKSALDSFSTSTISSGLSAWTALPADMMTVITATGVGPAASILVSALGIRFLLQLIPFVRLGS